MAEWILSVFICVMFLLLQDKKLRELEQFVQSQEDKLESYNEIFEEQRTLIQKLKEAQNER